MRATLRAACLLLIGWGGWAQETAPAVPAQASVWSARGGRLAAEERYLEAEMSYRRALRLVEAELGPERIEVSTLLNNLAIVHRCLGKLSEAEDEYRRALAIRGKLQGEGHRSAALVRVNLARLYLEMGRLDAAEKLLQATPAGAPRVEAAVRHNRALLLLERGRFTDAAAEAGLAAPLWREAGDRASEAKARALRGQALLRGKRCEQARETLEGALGQARAALGPRHPEVGRILWIYARALRKAGAKEEAKRARAASRAVLEDDPSRVAREHIVDVSGRMD